MRRAHHFCFDKLVGTLRFAHPTAEGKPTWINQARKTCTTTSRSTATASSTILSTPSSRRGWISSRDTKGNVNLAPYSFFNGFCYHPPIIGFSSTSWKDSVANIQDTGEFV